MTRLSSMMTKILVFAAVTAFLDRSVSLPDYAADLVDGLQRGHLVLFWKNPHIVFDCREILD